MCSDCGNATLSVVMPHSQTSLTAKPRLFKMSISSREAYFRWRYIHIASSSGEMNERGRQAAISECDIAVHLLGTLVFVI